MLDASGAGWLMCNVGPDAHDNLALHPSSVGGDWLDLLAIHRELARNSLGRRDSVVRPLGVAPF
jgi:hypothetical protein